MATKKPKNPWPTKAVMTQIYDMKLWGGKDVDFFSGFGSHNPEIVNPYINHVVEFLKEQNNALTVLDLGCGDFNIGKQLAPYTKHYIAIDIVEKLIERNKLLYQDNNIEFNCLDITKDALPKADCIILRQVLQHLSNSEIQDILKKLEKYKYIILTEHLPIGDFTPNANIISGQGIRLKKHSGIDILKQPFDFKIIKEQLLINYILKTNKEQITTTLYTVFN